MRGRGDVGLHQQLTPVSLGEHPKFGQWQKLLLGIVLGARDERPGRVIIWSGCCCGRETNLCQLNLSWERDGNQHGWGCPAGKQKELNKAKMKCLESVFTQNKGFSRALIWFKFTLKPHQRELLVLPW